MNTKNCIIIGVFITWLFQSTVGQAQDGTKNQSNLIEEHTMSNEIPSISGSRGRAPQVQAIVHHGIIYEQLLSPSKQGLDSFGGYVIAIEKSTGKQLWIAKLYSVEENSNLESDVQRVFFKSMQLAPTGDALLIEDEHHRHYHVRLADGEVIQEK